MGKKHVEINERANQVHELTPRLLKGEQRVAVERAAEKGRESADHHASRDREAYLVLLNAVQTLAYVDAFEQAQKRYAANTQDLEALEALQAATALVDARLKAEDIKSDINPDSRQQIQYSVEMFKKFESERMNYFAGSILSVYNAKMLQILKKDDEDAIISHWYLGARGNDPAVKVIAYLEKQMCDFKKQVDGTSNAVIALMVLGALVGAALVVVSQGLLLPVALTATQAMVVFFAGVVTFALSVVSAVVAWVGKGTREQTIQGTVNACMARAQHDLADQLTPLSQCKADLEQQFASVERFKFPESKFDANVRLSINDVMSDLNDLKRKIEAIKPPFNETKAYYETRYRNLFNATHQKLTAFLDLHARVTIPDHWLSTDVKDEGNIHSFLKNIEQFIDRHDAIHGMNVTWQDLSPLLEGDEKTTWAEKVKHFTSKDVFDKPETKPRLALFLTHCMEHYQKIILIDKTRDFAKIKRELPVLTKLTHRFSDLLAGDANAKFMKALEESLLEREQKAFDGKKLDEAQSQMAFGITALEKSMGAPTRPSLLAGQEKRQSHFWHVTEEQKDAAKQKAKTRVDQSLLNMFDEQLKILEKQNAALATMEKTPKQQAKFESQSATLATFRSWLVAAQEKNEPVQYLQEQLKSFVPQEEKAQTHDTTQVEQQELKHNKDEDEDDGAGVGFGLIDVQPSALGGLRNFG